MALLTLTTDLGTKDYYVAALKGAVINQSGYVPFIDITHSISLYNIREAAFTISQAYRHFPNGTIHIVHVNAAEARNRLLLAKADGHYFIAFDNGLLSLALDKIPHETYLINEELLEQNSNLTEVAIARVVNLLLTEYKPTDFAHLITEPQNLRLLQPVTTQGRISGSVIYIDHYGNAITNITPALFQQFIGDQPFTILASGIGNSNSLCHSYADVDEGELACFFNAAGFLEIAINKGRADHLLAIKMDSRVIVHTR